MGQLRTGEPVWELHFDENGNLTAPTRASFTGDVAGRGVEDLFIFSHGWGASQDDAAELYEEMFPLIRQAAVGVPGLGRLGFAGIYWPSLWFPPTPATPPPAGGGSLQATGGAAAPLSAGTAALTGAAIAASLAPGFADPDQQKAIVQIGQLIDEGQDMARTGQPDAAKRELITQISELIRSLAPPGRGEDSGERALLTAGDPADAYQQAAAVFGSTAAGGATQGIGDWFTSAINGVKDSVRVLSYWTMKARAGTIGQTGLGPLLTALRAQSPAIRVHLTGHSFGARLVSFALAGIGSPGESPVHSLTLLQGAFSHWSFAGATGNPFAAPGGLNGLGDRVHGPLVATFSSFDWAVGTWYPRASFLARQNLQNAGPDRWGGLGADGFQPAGAASTVVMPATGGLDYGFTPGSFYRIDAAKVICDTTESSFSGAHSDIRKLPVAQLVAAAAAAHG
jgi:hypothetical protein